MVFKSFPIFTIPSGHPLSDIRAITGNIYIWKIEKAAFSFSGANGIAEIYCFQIINADNIDTVFTANFKVDAPGR